MNWIEQLKRHKITTVGGFFVAVIGAVGTVVGAINSVSEFTELDWFDGADSWIAKTYVNLTGWLSTEVTFPVWSVLPVLALATLAVFRLRRQLADLASVTTELEKLKNPAAPALDAMEERVLFWATKIYDGRATGEGPTPAVIADASGIPLTVVDAALDVLKQNGIVRLKKFKSDPVDLTAEGRRYMAKQDVTQRFATFHFTADHARI